MTAGPPSHGSAPEPLRCTLADVASLTLPAEPSRQDLVQVVGMIGAPGVSERELDEVVEYLSQHLPDPAWTDIAFYPRNHPATVARGLTEPTPEEIVEIAFEYRPFAL